MKDVCDTLLARDWKDPKCVQVEDPFIVASRGRNPDNPSDRTTGAPTEQRLEPNFSGCTNTLTSVQKDNWVAEPQVKNVGNIYPSNGQNGNVYDVDGISPTINAGTGVKGCGIGSNNAPKIIVPDPIVYDDYNSRISSDQDAINTLTTNCGASAERNGVKILEPIVCEERRDEGIRFFKDECVGTLRTIDACGDKRVLEPEPQLEFVGGLGEKDWAKDGKKLSRNYPQGSRVYSSDGIASALTAQGVGGAGGYSGLYTVEEEPKNIRWRIRKLTPKECWRLMGFTDEDHDRASRYVSASSLYKQAGNSICTCCLVAIFNALFLHDYSTSYAEKLVNYNS
jgi:DNA (cytosine-5)-methyltransferase 1